ncbi:MAG: MarR family winged helix-turn-helix transcriptional regulator, partial [Desulforhopalus sp.]
MDDLQDTFNRVQDKLLAIVDLINTGHKGGVDYGTGDLLTPVEAHTIQAVGDNQGLNLTTLAETMNVTKATMSERVKKLSRQGLLRKSKALDNRKEILITLSDKGRLVQKGHEETHRKMFRFFASHYGDQTEEQLELFNRAFNDYLRLAQSVEK